MRVLFGGPTLYFALPHCGRSDPLYSGTNIVGGKLFQTLYCRLQIYYYCGTLDEYVIDSHDFVLA